MTVLGVYLMILAMKFKDILPLWLFIVVFLIGAFFVAIQDIAYDNAINSLNKEIRKLKKKLNKES